MRRRARVPGLACGLLVAPLLVLSPAPGPAQDDRGATGERARGHVVEATLRGDALAGRRVAMGAAGVGAAGACFGCHGLDGAGDGGSAFPRLAGQPANYLHAQLQAYADGRRPNEVMTPIAAALSDDDRRNVAAWYAGANARHRPPVGGDPRQLQLGGALAAVGSAARGVQACNGCHGPGGGGLPPHVPYLAGQIAAYTELQLAAWAEGRRRTDPLDVMGDVARRLTADERRAVARYYAALSPPQQP